MPILSFNIYDPKAKKIEGFTKNELQIQANTMFMLNSIRHVLTLQLSIIQIDIAILGAIFDELAAIPTIHLLLKDKEFVKRGHNIDYRRWITCYVSKTKQACIDWQKDNMAKLDKLGQKYSVNVKQYKESVR